MRRARLGGTCARCGASAPDGLFWENRLVVLDFGVPEIPPIEPDTTVPVLCDECELRRREREDADYLRGR
jgi:hypothetical protein